MGEFITRGDVANKIGATLSGNQNEFMSRQDCVNSGCSEYPLANAGYTTNEYVDNIQRVFPLLPCEVQCIPQFETLGSGEMLIQSGSYRWSDLTIRVNYINTAGVTGYSDVVLSKSTQSTTWSFSGIGRFTSVTVTPASDSSYLYSTNLTLSQYLSLSTTNLPSASGSLTLISSYGWRVVAPEGVSVKNSQGAVVSSGSYTTGTVLNITNINATAQSVRVYYGNNDEYYQDITVAAMNETLSVNNVSTGGNIVAASGSVFSVVATTGWTVTLLQGAGTASQYSGAAGTTNVTLTGTGSVGSYKAIWLFEIAQYGLNVSVYIQ